MKNEHVGGRLLGEGKHGAAYDVVGTQGDHDTVVRHLQDLASSNINKKLNWQIHIDRNRKQSRRNLKFPSDVNEFIRTLQSTGVGSVGKRVKDFETFDTEIRTSALVRAAYKEHTDKFTALRPVPLGSGDGLVGLSVNDGSGVNNGVYYIFGSRCRSTVDNVRMNDSLMRSMVTQLLQSLATVHAARVYHCDIKLGNVMLCAPSVFKLVDWGAAQTMSFLLKRYSAGIRRQGLGGSKSPMAWLAWGAPYTPTVSAAALFMLHEVYSDFPELSNCEEFRYVVRGAASSFLKIDEEVPSDAAGRRRLVRRYARSFDTFNLGILIAALVCRCPRRSLNSGTRSEMLTLARRLTHYGNDDFLQDARQALAYFLKARPKSQNDS